VLTDDGDVVGVTVAGADTSGNVAFAFTSDAARAFLTEHGVVQAEEPTPLLRTIRALQAGWLRQARRDLAAVPTPAPKVVDELQAELDRRTAAHERDLTPSPPRDKRIVPAIAGGAGLLVVALGLLALLLVLRRRRRVSPVAGADAPAWPYDAAFLPPPPPPPAASPTWPPAPGPSLWAPPPPDDDASTPTAPPPPPPSAPTWPGRIDP
jgi:hypothetical protein